MDFLGSQLGSQRHQSLRGSSSTPKRQSTHLANSLVGLLQFYGGALLIYHDRRMLPLTESILPVDSSSAMQDPFPWFLGRYGSRSLFCQLSRGAITDLT